MFVLVAPDSGAARPQFMDMQNLNQLHAEFRGVEDAPAGRSLEEAGIGTIEDGHVWLHIAALREAGDGGGDWNDRFDAMLRYAQRNGWVDAAGSRVRAHIVRS
ncbi:MAG TPA: hypothetical protein VMI73_22920 [Trebonia sp.]|nr:hypothetical protein [Trebonia sp.]